MPIRKLHAIITISLVAFLINSLIYSDAIGAAAKIGGTCTKIDALVKSGNNVLACTRSKTKLIWKIATIYQTVKYYDNAKAAAATAKWEKQVREQEARNAAIRAKAAPGEGQICLPEKKCLVGSKGPGGGTVFYDAGKRLSWGRYLEYAPSGWFGSQINAISPNGTISGKESQYSQDPKTTHYCEGQRAFFPLLDVKETSPEIGLGSRNTEYLVSNCISGPAVLAGMYSNNGKEDWFLPSLDELNEVCKFRMFQETGDPAIKCESLGPDGPGLRLEFSPSCAHFWSSTLDVLSSEIAAWGVYFGGKYQGIWGITDDWTRNFCSRPIRAF